MSNYDYLLGYFLFLKQQKNDRSTKKRKVNYNTKGGMNTIDLKKTRLIDEENTFYKKSCYYYFNLNFKIKQTKSLISQIKLTRFVMSKYEIFINNDYKCEIY